MIVNTISSSRDVIKIHVKEMITKLWLGIIRNIHFWETDPQIVELFHFAPVFVYTIYLSNLTFISDSTKEDSEDSFSLDVKKKAPVKKEIISLG